MTEADRIAQAFKDLDERSVGRWSLGNRGNRAMLDERRRKTRALLEAAGLLPLAHARVLEVGSGGGGELAWLLELGATPDHLVGIDLLPNRVESAMAAYPDLEFHAGSAEHLPFADATFDVVQAITLFSSIFDQAMARAIAAEIVRVMRPGGALLWYDFRYDNPSNKDVHRVTEADVRALFPTLQGRLHRLTLIPPLSRRLGVTTPALYPLLVRVPPLQSHLLGLVVKPAAV